MFICRTLRMCRYLIDNGFDWVETRPDKKNPKFDVWVFKDTPELSQCVSKYISYKK